MGILEGLIPSGSARGRGQGAAPRGCTGERWRQTCNYPAVKKAAEGLLTRACSDRPGRNGLKLEEGGLRYWEEILCFNSGEALAQVVPRGCGLLIIGNVQGQRVDRAWNNLG